MRHGGKLPGFPFYRKEAGRHLKLLLVLLIVALIAGARRLPELGSSVGSAVRNFRKAVDDGEAIDITPDKDGKGNQGRKT